MNDNLKKPTVKNKKQNKKQTLKKFVAQNCNQVKELKILKSNTSSTKFFSLSSSKVQQKQLIKKQPDQKSKEVNKKMNLSRSNFSKEQKSNSLSLNQIKKVKNKSKTINLEKNQKKIKDKGKKVNQMTLKQKDPKLILDVQQKKFQNNYGSIKSSNFIENNQKQKISLRTNNLMNGEICAIKKKNFPPQVSKSIFNNNQIIDIEKNHISNNFNKVQKQKIDVKIQNSQVFNSSKYQEIVSNIQKDMINFPNYLKMDNVKQVTKWQKNIMIMFDILQNDFDKNCTSKCINTLITIFSKSKEIYYSYATDNNRTKKFLISELIKAVIFNYLHIMPINFCHASFMVQNWKDVNVKTQLVTLSCKQFQEIKDVIDFAFDQLKNKNLFQKHYRPFQKFLWETILSFMEILKFNLCEIQFNYQKNTQISSQTALKQKSVIFSSLNLLLRITDYFKKKIFPQVIKQKQNQIKNLFRICISKVINYSYQIQFLQNKCEWANSFQIQKIRSNLKLPLYDWGMLSIKSRDFVFFKDIMNSCLQYFTQIYQQNAMNNKFVKRQTHQKIKDDKRRTTIMQAPIQLQNSNQWNQMLQPIYPVKKQFMEHIQTGCQQVQLMANSSDKKLKMTNFISPEINCLMIFSNILKMDWSQQIDHINSKRMELQVKLQEERIHQPLELKNQIKDFQMFVYIISYKDIIMKLISEIQFIDPSLISQQVCKGMIKIAHRCDFFKYQTNMEKIISQILKHDRYTKILQTCLVNQKKIINRLSTTLKGNFVENKNRFSLKDNFFNNQLEFDKKKKTNSKKSQNNFTFCEKQNQSWRSLIIKSCQNIFYNIQNFLQASMPFLPILYYEKQFAQQPQIFTTEIFFEKLLQYQPIQCITKFITTLVTTQIKKRKIMLRMTDLIKYFNIYIQFCLKIRQQGQIGVFLLGLQNSIFLEFNEMVYSQSIDQKFEKKFHLPELDRSKNKLALLLSAGAYEKHMTIDRFFPQTPQQLLWRQIFKKMYFIDLQMNYFVPKCFYGTIYYEFILNKYQKQTTERLDSFIVCFCDDIDKGKLSSVCSTFHLILVALQITQNNICQQIQPILHNRKLTNNRQSLGKSQSKDQKYQIIIQSIFFWIMQKHKKILDLFKQTEENQLKCMKNFSLTQQENKNIMKNLQQYKKMHMFLLQNIVRFFQIVQISPRFLDKLRHPQDYIEIISMFCKNTGIFCYQIISKLSKVSSNHIYHNLVQQKIKNQIALKSSVDFYLLKNLTLNWITHRKLFRQKSKKLENGKKSRSKKIKNEEQVQQINLTQIFDLCLQVLQKTVTGTSERQILKCKVIALQILKTVQEFLFQNNHEFQLIQLYSEKYSKRLRKVLLQLLLREKTLISKYEKQLFINIRLFILFWMIQNFLKVVKLQNNKIFSLEFISQKQFWYLLYILSFDEMIQVRISLLNACLSRFKAKQLKMFQMKKSRIWVIFMIMSIYQPQNKLKQLCQLILSSIKNQCEDVEDLLQSVLLCLHFLVNFNYQQLIKTKTKKLNENYFSQVLSQIFIDRKEVEYGLFSILVNLINEQKYGFQKIKLSPKNQLAFYYLATGGDYMYSKKEYFDLMDELKNCDQIPLIDLQDSKQKSNQNIFSQNEVIFQKLQKEALLSMVQRIKQNGKTGRIIKSKKDVIINWSQMQSCNIIRRKH